MSDSSSYYYKVGRYYYEVIPGKKFDTRSHTHLWDPIRYRFIFYRKNGKKYEIIIDLWLRPPVP